MKRYQLLAAVFAMYGVNVHAAGIGAPGGPGYTEQQILQRIEQEAGDPDKTQDLRSSVLAEKSFDPTKAKNVKTGDTTLMLAVKGDNEELVKFFIGDPVANRNILRVFNKEGETAFHLATLPMQHNVEIMTDLVEALKKGYAGMGGLLTTLNHYDKNKKTALTRAVEQYFANPFMQENYLKIARILVEAGATPTEGNPSATELLAKTKPSAAAGKEEIDALQKTIEEARTQYEKAKSAGKPAAAPAAAPAGPAPAPQLTEAQKRELDKIKYPELAMNFSEEWSKALTDYQKVGVVTDMKLWITKRLDSVSGTTKFEQVKKALVEELAAFGQDIKQKGVSISAIDSLILDLITQLNRPMMLNWSAYPALAPFSQKWATAYNDTFKSDIIDVIMQKVENAVLGSKGNTGKQDELIQQLENFYKDLKERGALPFPKIYDEKLSKKIEELKRQVQ